MRRVRVLPRDPGSGRVARRPRDGRRLEPQDRERPGADRDGPLRPAARPLPDRDHRRSPHAHDRGLQRAPEDARGAAAPRAVHPRLDRAPQDPRDDRFALPAVRLPRADGPRDRGAAGEGGEGREDRRDAGGAAPPRRGGRGQPARRPLASRPGGDARRRQGRRGALRRDPRARRLGAARGHVLGGRGRRPGRGDREPGAPDRGRRRPSARPQRVRRLPAPGAALGGRRRERPPEGGAGADGGARAGDAVREPAARRLADAAGRGTGAPRRRPGSRRADARPEARRAAAAARHRGVDRRGAGGLAASRRPPAPPRAANAGPRIVSLVPVEPEPEPRERRGSRPRPATRSSGFTRSWTRAAG